ncbi:hypothetical protein GCM10020258_04410 [Sphingomonas yabuuchiae]
MDRAIQLSKAPLMGWLILLLIAAGALGAALWLRFPRPLWTMLGAALALGAWAMRGRGGRPWRPARLRRAPMRCSTMTRFPSCAGS